MFCMIVKKVIVQVPVESLFSIVTVHYVIQVPDNSTLSRQRPAWEYAFVIKCIVIKASLYNMFEDVNDRTKY